MRLFRRRRRVNVGTYRPPLEWPEPTVEETVEEALLIANVAVKLALKNLIIVHALQERADYSADRLLAATREELRNLVDEKDADADRVDAQHAVATAHGGRATHQSDFRSVDAPTLARKAAVLRVLAKRLRELADDESYAANLIDVARGEALDEVLNAFAGTQSDSAEGTDAAQDDRATRRALIARDLEVLAASRRTNSTADQWFL
ncbi:MAG: hypothetical protein JWP85_1926 [Rhodoglobus sp.]|nr:hypothetical protein [Rhodoglobus sp.]